MHQIFCNIRFVSCSPHDFTNYPENFTNSEIFGIGETFWIVGEIWKILLCPKKPHCQFSPFGPFHSEFAELAVLFIWYLQNGLQQFFQLPWMPIIHFSLFPLSIECPNLLDIIKFSKAVCIVIPEANLKSKQQSSTLQMLTDKRQTN